MTRLLLKLPRVRRERKAKDLVSFPLCAQGNNDNNRIMPVPKRQPSTKEQKEDAGAVRARARENGEVR